MEDVIVISDSEDEGSPKAWLSPMPEDAKQDLVDLTNHQCVSPDLSSHIIDLTATEETLQLNSEGSLLNDELSSSHLSEETFSSSSGEMGSYSEDVSEDGTSNGSWRTADSSMGSPTNEENDLLQQNRSPSTKKDQHVLLQDASLTLQDWSSAAFASDRNGPQKMATIFPELSPKTQLDPGALFTGSVAKESDAYLPTLQDWSPLATSASCTNDPDYATAFPEVSKTQSDPAFALTAPVAKASDTQLPTINKALMYKLQHFQRPPVNHFFHKLRERRLHPAPIPHSRMRIVDSPKDENFHQGTLHFLSEFVTAQHYPPKETVRHVIQSILLGAEEQAIQNEAYMVLMKVQKLHPATVTTVAWDWNMLSEVIKKDDQTCLLFFQYALQTLDDDFQLHVQKRSFQKSLCRALLSCEKYSANIKNVIDWLIVAVEKACKDVEELTVPTQWEKRLVVLLQRMLSIAVEVDNLPVTNSSRIAELLFPKVIVLKTRQQRELFLSSTENFLLRAKILEIIFQNSCKSLPAPGLPLSLYKILHFIGNSTLLLENQGPEWQRWDELLHHMCLLYFSLQRITTDHLRLPITDRTDKMLQWPQPCFPLCEEDITEADLNNSMNHLWKRTSFGSNAPEALQNRFQMLKSLLLLDVKKQSQ